MSDLSSTLPFQDIIVVETGGRIGAAACGSLLAMAGATVIVIEPENAPTAGKYRARAAACAGKRSLMVRPGCVEDDALFQRALQAADVVIGSSDFPGDLDFAAHVRGDAIICDITAFPHRVPSSDLLDEKMLQALTGIGAVTGTSEGAPTLSDAAVLELGAGIYAASGIAAALRVRRLHGGGQTVSSTLYGTGVNGLVTFLPFHFSGKIPPRGGNRHPMCAPWNAYHAKDGWLLLCSANDEQWKRLCGLMERPELATEGELALLAGRVKNVDATDAVVQAWTITKTVDEAVEALRKADIAAGPIVAVDELSKNPNVQHRRMVRRLKDPETGETIEVPGPPLAGGRAAAEIPARDSGRAFVRELAAKSPSSQGNGGQVRPLAGIRVLEIGQYTTAPLAAKQMAALGADVIKIEPLTGESSRAWPPHLNGESYFFTLNNTNKRSLAVDLRSAEDRAVFSDLLRTSDVLVENLKPGSLARLGFSYEELKKLNPKLVYCAISGYGADSAYPGRPAFDTVIQAMCGLMDLTRAEGIPTKLGISIADTMGGMMGLFSILAMLEQRDLAGVGSFTDLAMQDVGVWATHTAWGTSNRSPHAIIRCEDGEIAALEKIEQVHKALSAAGISAERTNRDRVASVLLEVGIAAAPVRTVDEVGASEKREGGFIRMVEVGPSQWPLLELPFRLSRMQNHELRPIGPLGGANKEFGRASS